MVVTGLLVTVPLLGDPGPLAQQESPPVIFNGLAALYFLRLSQGRHGRSLVHLRGQGALLKGRTTSSIRVFLA